MKGRHVTEKRANTKKNDQLLPLHIFSPHFIQEDLSKSFSFILFWESRKPSELVKQLLIERKNLSSKFVSELFPASLTHIVL